MWTGLLYHVTGTHVFPDGGSCAHEFMAEGTVGEDKSVLAFGGDAYLALRAIVMDDHLLNDMCLCVDYLHTSEVEAFNSLRLKYLPKRTAFTYTSMVLASMVAAMDHNYHLRRQYSVKANGTPLVHRKFNPRSKQDFVSFVKEAKNFPHVLAILALVRKFAMVPQTVPEQFAAVDFVPTSIAPTIRRMTAASASSATLLSKQTSRFSGRNNSNNN